MPEMTEDEKLVERIATGILGWHKEAVRSIKGFAEDQWQDAEGNYRMSCWEFDPLRDHNHSALVVEKMRELDFNFDLIYDPSGVYVSFTHYDAENYEDIRGNRTGHAIPEVTCRAALAALEAVKGGGDE